MGGWMGVSVGQWVGLGHITKYQINLDLIKINQFCLNIYDLLDILDIFLDILLKPPQPLMGLFFPPHGYESDWLILPNTVLIG